METPYRAISYNTYDPLTREDMDQLAANLQHIHDNTPRGRMYRGTGDDVTPTELRTVILCGRVPVGQSKKEDTVRKSVSFGRAFDPECRPNVTIGIISGAAGNVFCVVNGPDDRTLPTSNGCEIKVTAPNADGKIRQRNWQIAKPIIINWQAFGFRAVGVNGL